MRVFDCVEPDSSQSKLCVALPPVIKPDNVIVCDVPPPPVVSAAKVLVELATLLMAIGVEMVADVLAGNWNAIAGAVKSLVLSARTSPPVPNALALLVANRAF